MMLDRSTQIEFLLDHYHNPRNFGKPDQADVEMQGGQPGCSDLVTVYLKLSPDGQHLEDIHFTGEGCTISQAATSILTEELQGASISDIAQMDYHLISELLGEELVQVRPRCATLGLDTIKAALVKYRLERRASE